MIVCFKCKIERNEDCYLVDKKTCYKCIYDQKIKNIEKSQKSISCRECGAFCPNGRWVYCSMECADMGGFKQKREYWTANVKLWK